MFLLVWTIQRDVSKSLRVESGVPLEAAAERALRELLRAEEKAKCRAEPKVSRDCCLFVCFLYIETSIIYKGIPIEISWRFW